MRLKLILALAAAGLAGGCVTVRHISDWSTIDPGPAPDYELTKARVEEAMRETLKDPYSAQFRRWSPLHKVLYSFGEAAPMEPLWQICVQMNAKNSYGGYVGFKTYFVKLRNGQPIMDDYGYSENATACQVAMGQPERLHEPPDELPQYVDVAETTSPAPAPPQRRIPVVP